jgi:hypothetical protein
MYLINIYSRQFFKLKKKKKMESNILLSVVTDQQHIIVEHTR